MRADPPSLVLVLDLRDPEQLHDVLTRPFGDIQSDYLDAAGVPEADVGRTLLIARVEDLQDRAHQLACERVLALGWARVLCLIVGAPLDEQRVLARPGSLRNTGVGLLWIGDARGVPLRPGSVRPGASTVRRTGDPFGAALLPLRRVLEIPGVFDRVLAGVEELPDQAASPGLELVADRIRPEVLSEAWLHAVTGMVGGLDADRARTERFGPTLDRLAGGVSGDDAGGPLHPGSPLATRAEACERAVRRVQAELARLVRPGRLLGSATSVRSARDRMAGLGDELGGYRELVRTAFLELDELSTADPAAAETLARRRGVQARPAAAEPAQVVEELKEFVERGFAARRRLRDLADDLNGLGGRTMPQGSAARIAEIDAACPEHLIRRLRKPQPPSAGPPRILESAGFGLGAALMAGAWPAGYAAGALAVLAVILISLLIMRTGTRGGAATGFRRLSVLARGTVAAMIGAGVGAVAGYALRPPAAVAAAVGIAGLLTVGFAATRWWSAVIARWRRETGVDDAGRAIAALRSLLRRVAIEEWTLAPPRRAASDRTRLLAGVLDTMADRLAEAVATETGRGDRWWAEDAPPRQAAEPGDHPQRVLADVEQIIRDDLTAAAIVALRPLWAQLERGTRDDALEVIGDRLSAALTEYDGHLRRNGIQQQPSFAPVASRRQALVEQSWHESELLGAVLQIWQPGAALTQLCDWDQTRLLDLTRGAERYVRFAPEAARQAVLAQTEQLASWEPLAQALESVQWLRLGYLAGVLRLVPLRPHTVATQWLDTDEEPGVGAESGQAETGEWGVADFGDDPGPADGVRTESTDELPDGDWTADDYESANDGWAADDWSGADSTDDTGDTGETDDPDDTEDTEDTEDTDADWITIDRPEPAVEPEDLPGTVTVPEPPRAVAATDWMLDRDWSADDGWAEDGLLTETDSEPGDAPARPRAATQPTASEAWSDDWADTVFATGSEDGSADRPPTARAADPPEAQAWDDPGWPDHDRDASPEPGPAVRHEDWAATDWPSQEPAADSPPEAAEAVPAWSATEWAAADGGKPEAGTAGEPGAHWADDEWDGA